MRTPQTPKPPRLTKLKRAAQEDGVPYTSYRDAGLRGEFPLVRIGRALYMETRDRDRWIEARKSNGA